MAVALATLPLKRRLAGDGDTFFISATGTGWLADFTDFADAFAGLAAGLLLAATLAAGLTAGFAAATGLDLVLVETTFLDPAWEAVDWPPATFFAAVFFGAMAFFGEAAFFATVAFCGAEAFLTAATFFGVAFFATALFATGFFAGLDLPPCGFAAALTGTDLAFDFTALSRLAGGCFADGFDFVADLATVWPAFAGALLAFFTTFPFAAVVFDAAVLTTFALIEALSFSAFVLELPVVFAISLHRGWPWRPGVIAHVSFTSKSDSGILLTLHPQTPFRQRESSDSIDTVVAPVVQALDQPIAWTPVPLLPELLRLCTDCGDSLWTLARQPAGWLAPIALPALVQRRAGSGSRAFSLRPLPRPGRLSRWPLTLSDTRENGSTDGGGLTAFVLNPVGG